MSMRRYIKMDMQCYSEHTADNLISVKFMYHQARSLKDQTHVFTAAMQSSLSLVLVLLIFTQLSIGEVGSEIGLVNTTLPPPTRAGDEIVCSCDRIEKNMERMKADLLLEIKRMIQQSLQRDNANDIKKSSRNLAVDVEDIDATVMQLSKLGRKKKLAAKSCGEVRDMDPSARSRNYWLKGEAEVNPGRIYCDFEFEPPLSLRASVFNATELEVGWMRLFDLDMHRPRSACPDGLLQVDSPRKACGNRDGYGCNSITFSSHGVPYRRVCGMVRGYRHLSSDAFFRYDCPSCENDINSAYLDGVSITYGRPRTHIWSYASVWTKDDSAHPPRCPCNNDAELRTPDFVGEDYYCEGGGDDELWDGKECTDVESSCCRRPGLPWFCKELSEPTTDDLEVRLCIDQGVRDENVFVDLMQIYVQ